MRSAAPVAVVLAALAVARIEAAVLPCHGCNADQYQLMAMGHGVGQHLVFDFPNQRLSAFTVRCEDQQPAGEGSLKPAEGWRMPCALGLVVESLPLDPAAEEAFRMARQLWLETGGTFRKHVVVAAGEVDAGPSALLLTRDATQRTKLADRLYDHWPLGRELSSVIRTFLALFASDPVVEVFEVVFEDGSRMRVECQLSRQRCAYERGSARDPFDQPIFDGGSPEPSEYRLGERWAGLWVLNARAHGIAVQGVDGGGRGEVCVRCEVDPATRRLVCAGRRCGD